MNIFKLEHSKTAYRADLALYCMMVLALAAFLLVYGPRVSFSYWGIVAYR